MKAALLAFVVGIVFAVGLALGGMLDTRAVIGFLDLAHFDPRLVFVMGGAIGVFLPVHRLVVARSHGSELAAVYRLPTLPVKDPRLILGAVLFGIGWGLVGYCPGPALVSLGAAFTGLGVVPSVAFVAAMAAGMVLHRVVARRFLDRDPNGIDA